MYSDLSLLSTQMTTIVYIIFSNTCRLQYENTSANLSLYVDCGFVFNEKVDHICISLLGRYGERCVPSLRERHTWQAPHLIQVKTFIVNCLFNEYCYAVYNKYNIIACNADILYTQPNRSYLFIDVVRMSETQSKCSRDICTTFFSGQKIGLLSNRHNYV